jgi:formylglycine-generating enzyme required for sulfatase activity
MIVLAANTALAQPPKAKDGPLGMKFVPLAKATFYMGWDGAKKGVKKEINRDFEFAVHTVTQEQWQAVMGSNPSHFSRAGKGKAQVKAISDADLKLFPVESVSWYDAQEFITKLNKREEGRGYVYCLPSEAEWEYACRGGATSEEECSYHFYLDKPTNDLSSKQANFDGNFPSGKAEPGPYLERPTKVGSYAPNKLGLYDMHGNVYQWCADLVAPGFSGRVYRGGAWRFDAAACRSASRLWDEPGLRVNGVGFRLARVAANSK